MEPRLKSHRVPLYTLARNSRNADLTNLPQFSPSDTRKFLVQTERVQALAFRV